MTKQERYDAKMKQERLDKVNDRIAKRLKRLDVVTEGGDVDKIAKCGARLSKAVARKAEIEAES